MQSVHFDVIMSVMRARESENIAAVIFDFTIKCIHDLDVYESEIVYIRGHEWQIKVRRCKDDFEVFLCSKVMTTLNNWVIFGKASVTINPKYGQTPYTKTIGPFSFNPKATHGGGSLISWSDLVDHGYVENDNLHIKCEIVVDPLQNLNGYCEMVKFETIETGAKNGKYRLKVNQFQGLLGVSSPGFILADIPIRIVVVNDEPGFYIRLSYLQPENVTVNWYRKANIDCKILSNIPYVRPIEPQFGKVKFQNELVKSSLIKWKELVDTNKQYIMKDGSFTIEIEIKFENEDDTQKNGSIRCQRCFASSKNNPIFVAPCLYFVCGRCMEYMIEHNARCPKCAKIMSISKFYHFTDV